MNGDSVSQFIMYQWHLQWINIGRYQDSPVTTGHRNQLLNVWRHACSCFKHCPLNTDNLTGSKWLLSHVLGKGNVIIISRLFLIMCPSCQSKHYAICLEITVIFIIHIRKTALTGNHAIRTFFIQRIEFDMYLLFINMPLSNLSFETYI